MGLAERDLERVDQAARKEARDELRLSVRLARMSGETLEAIGRAAGLDRQRVAEVIEEA